jgi:lactaldehyde dehydrogenase
MLIDGSWVDADDRTDVINPYDGTTVGTVPVASREQVREAIDAAEEAASETSLSAYERYELLSIAADHLEERIEEVAETITSEQGKPIEEARTEADRSVQTLRLSAEEAKRQFGEYVPMDPQKGMSRDHCFTQPEPMGVVAGITPFNFPLMLMAHKVGPALAAGNAFVGKPATTTPFSALVLFECLDAAVEEMGAPDGLVNIVTGHGSTIGEEIVNSEAIDSISFTGSTAVGKYLANNSGMTDVMLELGGNDPTIMWSDTDVERAAAEVVQGACSNAGQVCNSVERVIVDEEIEDEALEALSDAASRLNIGDPVDEGTDISAMVSDDEFAGTVELFEETVEQGATVEYGGRYGGELGDRVFEPTVLGGVTPDMPAASEETFGPLIPVIAVGDFDEALEEANNTEYGLEAGLFTQDIDRAKRAADTIDAGGVNINTVSGFRTDHMPYGGFKDSGKGKEGIKYTVEHFSRSKLVGFHEGMNS